MDRLILAALAWLATSLVRGESLTYSIYAVHGKDCKLLATDTLQYSFADIEVRPDSEKSDCKNCSRRLLQLEDGFSIGIHLMPQVIVDGSMVGIGLWVSREGDADGFSWEWFNHAYDVTFDKLIGGGRIRVTLAPDGDFVRITSIEFLDDITFDYKENVTVGQPGDRTHAVVVARGSVLKLAR